ncbi:unnamed protein product [Gongylonema pulchrum]|uniref:PH domain-containing protein n=1 Tax=Gongylonema pulchrum TaxID=637853 RepID=A0A183EFE1_9BILA|nr:unnamed protein product [Gongylonema pulchrum]
MGVLFVIHPVHGDRHLFVRRVCEPSLLIIFENLIAVVWGAPSKMLWIVFRGVGQVPHDSVSSGKLQRHVSCVLRSAIVFIWRSALEHAVQFLLERGAEEREQWLNKLTGLLSARKCKL